jgi:hypothetical protein
MIIRCDIVAVGEKKFHVTVVGESVVLEGIENRNGVIKENEIARERLPPMLRPDFPGTVMIDAGKDFGDGSV